MTLNTVIQSKNKVMLLLFFVGVSLSAFWTLQPFNIISPILNPAGSMNTSAWGTPPNCPKATKKKKMASFSLFTFGQSLQQAFSEKASGCINDFFFTDLANNILCRKFLN